MEAETVLVDLVVGVASACKILAANFVGIALCLFLDIVAVVDNIAVVASVFDVFLDTELLELAHTVVVVVVDIDLSIVVVHIVTEVVVAVIHFADNIVVENFVAVVVDSIVVCVAAVDNNIVERVAVVVDNIVGNYVAAVIKSFDSAQLFDNNHLEHLKD